MANVILNKELINAAKTERGGFTAKQLRILGIAWPPKKGWAKDLRGRCLDGGTYQRFVDAKNPN